MARPSKTTVDYFPHQCEHGKTIFIVEQKYKNDGYAFWFKLLEQLGSTPGHSLLSSDTAAMEYMAARCHISRESCTEILNLLASLSAIDKDLWASGIIWSDNFINKLSPLYDKRHTKPPDKPGFRVENPQPACVFVEKTPQSKVKESKVNKSKEEPPEIPGHLANLWPAFLEMRKSKRSPATGHAQALTIKELEKLYPADHAKQRQCLEQSIQRSWLGVFEIKQNGYQQAPVPQDFLCRKCGVTKIKSAGGMCRACIRELEEKAQREKEEHAGGFDSPGAKKFMDEVKKLTEAKSVRETISGSSGKYPCTECGKEHNDQPGVVCRPCSAALLKKVAQKAGV